MRVESVLGTRPLLGALSDEALSDEAVSDEALSDEARGTAARCSHGAAGNVLHRGGGGGGDALTCPVNKVWRGSSVSLFEVCVRELCRVVRK